jgi:hypothetical protein
LAEITILFFLSQVEAVFKYLWLLTEIDIEVACHFRCQWLAINICCFHAGLLVTGCHKLLGDKLVK